MAYLRPTLSQISLSQSNFPRNSTWNNPQHCFFHKRIAKLQNFNTSKSSTSFRVCSSSKDTQNQNSGEEPPESLFMKELKRRGMNPTSLLEDYKQPNYGLDEEAFVNEEDKSFPKRKAVSTDVERGLENQRERSMALNSEGLEEYSFRASYDACSNFLALNFVNCEHEHWLFGENNQLPLWSTVGYEALTQIRHRHWYKLKGLVPRAKLLLTLGGTFFLAFGPLILITVAFFSALYFYFGPSFVHDGSKLSLSTPQYVDPYALLEDDRISQIAPRLN